MDTPAYTCMYTLMHRRIHGTTSTDTVLSTLQFYTKGLWENITKTTVKLANRPATEGLLTTREKALCSLPCYKAKGYFYHVALHMHVHA